LLYEKDPEIAARAGAIALMVGDEEDKRSAVKRLIEALPTADRLLQGEIRSLASKELGCGLARSQSRNSSAAYGSRSGSSQK